MLAIQGMLCQTDGTESWRLLADSDTCLSPQRIRHDSGVTVSALATLTRDRGDRAMIASLASARASCMPAKSGNRIPHGK